ncbi:hypothetical protein [Psychrobacter sp. I-STPA10]|uniref:hypothetical protein n=1 Tax=Psychrobacter sp. I-STPA10 TaxID=2585769 RepID=UPI001E2D5C5A|nr:hypothetical protein [Psychrobacter sp. I-STPA10]
MYSEQYYYYFIQSDDNHSQTLDILTITDCLLATGLFKQIDHQSFSNSENFAWVNITLVKAINHNFGLSAENELNYINLISIIGSKIAPESIYIQTFKNIAKQLNWRLYYEYDDDGNENT